MGVDETKTEEETSKMFVDNNNLLSSDEELALHIMHRFNIDLDTLESMPAFDKTLKQMFWNDEEK
jgi:hypothetical protein